MSAFNLDEIKRRMTSAVEVLKKEFSGLRTGRANPHLLEPIKVDAYGSMTPLTQVGSINAPEPRLLSVQVWDNSLVKAVEKAIRDANMGLNPAVDGNLIRIPIPALTQERRQELVKLVKKYAEECKVALRNVRRDAMDALKEQEKKKQISEDEHKRLNEQVQKSTDEFVKKVDELSEQKEKEINQI